MSEDKLLYDLINKEIDQYSLDGMEEADLRALLKHQLHLRMRPAMPSDSLGAAFSTLSFIEGIYGRIRRTAGAKHEAYLEDIRAAERPDASEDSPPGGGAR